MHTGTFKTRQDRADKGAVFGAFIVLAGGLGAFVPGANEEICIALIYGGLGLIFTCVSGQAGLKVLHDIKK